jgi:SAM-dependent methyltransferase
MRNLRQMDSALELTEQARLTDEARFADSAYSKFPDQLSVNETLLRRYALPVDEWDWRQWGAKRLGPIDGRRVLDFGCGAGEETVYLAKMGGHVTAVDISPVGVRLTTARAAFNNVGDRVKALRMRCDPTDFPSGSFDVIHGFGILHHVGLRAGLLEVKRLLAAGGRGLFFEHMGNSPWIERVRPKEGHYTEGERPVCWDEIMKMSSEFSRLEAHPFHITSRLKAFAPIFGWPIVKRFDHALLSTFPWLRYFASGVVIYLER